MSPLVDGRIQAFPVETWEQEFDAARHNGFHLMEWTLDHDGLHENPLLTRDGQRRIRDLMQRCDVDIPSLTGDCFMQSPFWKANGQERHALEEDFVSVVDACGDVGISMVVLPLVDNGRIETPSQERSLVQLLRSRQARLQERGVRVLFESDFEPASLSRFIEQFDSPTFGVNYDIGNSAALGFDPAEEISAYGHRIMNVHVKDRLRGGTTVPLGSGAADFRAAVASLKRAGYDGNFILQTARAVDGDHVGALCRYRDMTARWLGVPCS